MGTLLALWNHPSKETSVDETTVKLVKTSWAQVQPIAADAGALFYGNLFEADPALKPLFKGDIAQQAARLMQMIDAAVGQLHAPQTLLPVLQQLGRRHVAYGVVPAHYDTVGGALLKTLEQGLGEAFTADVKSAWTTVYGVIASTMIQAAQA